MAIDVKAMIKKSVAAACGRELEFYSFLLGHRVDAVYNGVPICKVEFIEELSMPGSVIVTRIFWDEIPEEELHGG